MSRITPILLAALCAPALHAQENVDFDRYDANGDGYLTATEWEAVDVVVVDFDTLDTDRDGQLTRDEANPVAANAREGVMERAAQQGDTSRAQRDDVVWDTRQQSAASDARSEQGEDDESATLTHRSGVTGDDVTVQDDNSGDYTGATADEVNATAEPGQPVTAGDRNSTEQTGDDNIRAERSRLSPLGASDPVTGGEGTRGGRSSDRGANQGGARDNDEVAATGTQWNRDAFENYDANDDGLLDDEETADVEYVSDNFDRWDIDGDGFLTTEEADQGWSAESSEERR